MQSPQSQGQSCRIVCNVSSKYSFHSFRTWLYVAFMMNSPDQSNSVMKPNQPVEDATATMCLVFMWSTNHPGQEVTKSLYRRTRHCQSISFSQLSKSLSIKCPLRLRSMILSRLTTCWISRKHANVAYWNYASGITM